MGGLSNDPIPNPPSTHRSSPTLPPTKNLGVEKFPFEIETKRLEIDQTIYVNRELIGIHGQATKLAHLDPHVPKQRVVNRRPQIEHNIWGRRTA